MEKFRILVVAIVIALEVLTSLYTWRGLKGIIKKEKNRKRLRWTMIGYSIIILSLTFLFFSVPFLSSHTILRNYIASVYFIILLSKLIFCLFVFAEDILKFFTFLFRSLFRKKKKEQPAPAEKKTGGITRGEFIYHTGVAISAMPVFFMVRGMIKGGYDYRVHYVDVPVKGLPKAFNGLRILQLSDIHSGSFFNKDAVKRGIDMVNEQHADIFFFTGDLVNERSDEVDDYMDVFSGIKKPDMGCYSILGNHDYGLYYPYWKDEKEREENMQHLYRAHASLGWQLMRNEHDVLTRNGEKIGLLGVENWGRGGRFPRLGDINQAKKAMPEVPVKILLSHDPSHWDAVVRPEHPDINLMLAGHTHGMQFGVENKFIRFSPVQYLYKQWADLYTEGDQSIYVNRGYGFIGFPGRVGIKPEITVITLRG